MRFVLAALIAFVLVQADWALAAPPKHRDPASQRIGAQAYLYTLCAELAVRGGDLKTARRCLELAVVYDSGSRRLAERLVEVRSLTAGGTRDGSPGSLSASQNP
jgi:hypothetical protein